jgi:membrane protein
MKRYIKAIASGFVDFFRSGGLMLAGSISYFSMMAIIPFCLLLVTIFGYFLGRHNELLGFFLSKLISFFPDITHGITNEMKKIISYKGIGPLTFVAYGLLSYQLFASLEKAVNIIFKTRAGRHPLISIILSVLIITLIIIFIVASFAATYAISMLKELRDLLPGVHVGNITAFLIGVVVPLILLFLTATALYVLLPRKKVKLPNAFSGALFTAVFMEAAKHLFTVYVVRVAKLGTIYGPLSAFIIFLLWVFCSSCVFLIGARIVYRLELSGRK